MSEKIVKSSERHIALLFYEHDFIENKNKLIKYTAYFIFFFTFVPTARKHCIDNNNSVSRIFRLYLYRL